METYRLFVAAELPPDVKAELVTAQERLRRGLPSGPGAAPITWVAPAAMHLTLRFLGETSVARIPELGTVLGAALAHHAPMDLRLAGAGAFPNERRPSVVWAGVEGAVAALARAQADVEAAIANLGFAPESRPFRVHLTLGRVRREAGQQLVQRLGAAIRALPPLKSTPWTVERVALFRSELRREGPIYTEILDFRL
jgi:2'-5' RNA ligase